MRFLKYLLWILVCIAGSFIVFLAYATIDNYSPPPDERLFETETPDILADSTFSMVTWNIGYAGLDSTMDFFYDGGKMVRPERENTIRNLKNILLTLEYFNGTDFILLQEVDEKSKRSYRINIYDKIVTLFDPYHSSFARNYDVAFVPLPPTEPMGKVVSGLQTLSAPTPVEVKRYSFPGNYSWPMNLFMLDRCFMVNRYPLTGGNDLVVINTHNSAYDDGSLRAQQMAYLKNFLSYEYAAGNHVVAGGDWNQCPPDFAPAFPEDIFDRDDLTYIEDGYPEQGWSWAYDPKIPTNRRVMIPYTQGKTPATVIDFFLLSPNIELIEVKGMELGFAASDHQPVIMHFKLQ
ncbi:MAG: endonuclease/exonuclease/phosphatase family protein [Bacteroidales bacterium]